MNTARKIIKSNEITRLRDSHKTVNRTFRVNAEAATQLQRIAEEKRVSTNSLVNMAIQKAVADAPLEGLRLTEVPEGLILKVMDCLPDEELPELAESVSSFAREFVWAAFKQISIESVLGAFKLWQSRWENRIQLSHVREGGRCTIVLKYSFGKKWSKFLAESLRQVFKDLLGISLELRDYPNQIVASFADP